MSGPTHSIRWAALAAAVGLIALAFVAGGAAAGASTASDGNVTLYRAPDATLDSAMGVEAVIENGTRDPAAGMVAGETLVVAIDSPRLAEAVANGSGSPTDRFLDAVGGNATFHIEETNPSTMRPPKVARLGAANVTVYRSNTTVYVLLDTGALTFGLEGDRDEREPWRDGDRFAVTFGYDVDTDPPSGPTFELYSAKAEFFDQRRHEPLPPEVVKRTVRVHIEPTDAVVARLTLGDDRTRTATVGPVEWTGFQGVSFDLRDVEPGTPYSLKLIYDGEVVDRSSGTVREPRAELSDVTLTEVTTDHRVTRDGERVTETITDHAAVNLTARLSHGGEVIVLDDRCTAIGQAWVDPANETRLTIRLWDEGQPIRDPDLEGSALAIGSHRYDRASVDRYRGEAASAGINGGVPGCQVSTRVSTATATAMPGDAPAEVTTSVNASPSPDAVTVDPTTRSPLTDGTTRSPGQPGFTAIAAVVALTGFALGRLRCR